MALRSRLYIYAIDGGQSLWDDPADWIEGALTVGEIYHTSVKDMVSKIIKHIGSSRIQNLLISGHGSPGYQSVGAGTSWDTTGNKSLQLEPGTMYLLGDAEMHLRSLNNHFAPGAIVTLGGCEVGKDLDLVKAVSMALDGRPVQAGTANQRPLVPGMEGHVIRCSARRCDDLGSSYWASPGSWVQ